MTKLKPCPFCGRADKLKVWSTVQRVGDGKIENWRVSCNAEGDETGCGGTGGTRRTRSEAIEAWNKRTIITKHDKYTFNGEWACTDHMTIIQNGENNKHIENHGNMTITIGK